MVMEVEGLIGWESVLGQGFQHSFLWEHSTAVTVDLVITVRTTLIYIANLRLMYLTQLPSCLLPSDVPSLGIIPPRML